MKFAFNILVAGILCLSSFFCFGQRNLYVKQLAADSIRARADTMNFLYNFSPPFSFSSPTLSVNDTLLHLWVQNQAGGGGAFWPLSGTGNLTGNVDINGSGNNLLLGVTGANTIEIRNQDAANDFARFFVQEFGAVKNALVQVASPTSTSSVLLDPDDIQVTIGTGAANTGGQINLSSGVNSFVYEDYATVQRGIQYNTLYNFDNLSDNSLTQKGHLNARIENAQITIPSADILTLNTTPILLTPVPAPGSYVQLVSQVTCYLSFGTAAYTTNTTVEIEYASGQNVANFVNILAEGADSFNENRVNIPTTAAGNVLGDALRAFVPGGNPATGDGDIVIVFAYRTITLF